VRKAVEVEGGAMRVLRDPEVFYEPAHEIHYYEALGHEAIAERPGADRASELRAAIAAWRAFVGAAGDHGRFVETARRNLERVENALAAPPADPRGEDFGSRRERTRSAGPERTQSVREEPARGRWRDSNRIAPVAAPRIEPKDRRGQRSRTTADTLP
jgi:hypothetical protein